VNSDIWAPVFFLQLVLWLVPHHWFPGGDKSPAEKK
jgi:hypothetical protein